jgi:nucleoside-diphosphate-sugar epimerase
MGARVDGAPAILLRPWPMRRAWSRQGVSDKRVATVPNMNWQNLRKDLGFEPRYTMETGLPDCVNTVRKAAGLPPGQGVGDHSNRG